MKKRRYRAKKIKQIRAEELVEKFDAGGRVVMAVDVAKEDMYAAFMDDDEVVQVLMRWKHPVESPRAVELAGEVQELGYRVEAVMEPSSTYGDALREALGRTGASLHRVNPKRTHDAREVYDGVPSLHDPKSAAIVGKLHLDGRSEPWPAASDSERDQAAAVKVLHLHKKEESRNCNRLEPLLARHWPELTEQMSLRSVTLLEFLMAFPSAQDVQAKPEGAGELMRRIGGPFLKQKKVDAVIESAHRTFGLAPTKMEREQIRVVAREARRAQKLAREMEKEVARLVEADPATQRMAAVVGKTTAAVLVASAGDPAKYPTAEAYRKSLGLNLREKSSGKEKGALHITKRGPGAARLVLWMAALRLIQHERGDEVIQRWYARKVKRQAGKGKSKALVAIMRKLVLGLWHVARGEVFDSRRLFDVRRLGLEVCA